MKKMTDELYRDFFDFARFPMLLVEEDTTIALCNKAFEALSGYTSEEVQGRMSWAEMVADPDELKKMREYHSKRRLEPGSVPEEYEFQMTDRAGNRKYIALTIAMLPGTKRSLAFLQDITEKKKSETWYKAVFENTGLPSIIIDSDTTIIKANTEWTLLSGYSIEENEGKLSWTSFVDKEDLERMRDYHKTRRDDASGAPRKYEFRFIRRNGEVRHMINSVTMIPGSPYSIASLMDITDLKEAETERKNLEDQLQQARKLESIGHLAGGIAHDFNNMLAAIMGYSQMVQIKLKGIHSSLLEKRNELLSSLDGPCRKLMETGVNEKDSPLAGVISAARECISMAEEEMGLASAADEMVDEVIKASQRAGDLTRQLLAFARKQTLSIKSINLNSVVSGFEKMLRRTIRENVEIGINLAPDIHAAEADAGQIEQIILNLALNAQDAMPDGGKLLIKTGNKELDVHYAKKHEGIIPGLYVMLEISDTGRGMDKETQQRIFEPFFTTKDPGKGTGLGLATVYGIVKQHLGSIWFYSEPGKGTTFRIYLPRAEKEPERCREVDSETGASGTEMILVVEDQEQVRKMTSMMLKHQGYSVLEASNGHEALETADNFKGVIHLVVSDVVMPGMNGRELYNELLKKRPALKALFLSGYPMEIISHHGILEEGYNFLPKPVTIEEFTRRVREILDKNRNINIC
ncbi:MAG TPA: PAS domain S-box protein [Spirochaetota bacterium]|nr:PAS domain S-box protein [Spirochaetota bacterium]